MILLLLFQTVSLLPTSPYHVPGDYATLAQANAQAAPGETIIVHGGVHPPVRVSKPLTFVGLDAPVIQEDPLGFVIYQRPGFELAGPGSGMVAISGFHVESRNSTIWLAEAAPGIAGGGFDALIVEGCVVFGGDYLEGPDSPVIGAPAIDVTVADLFVSSSYVKAADCGGGDAFWAFAALPGIRGVNVFVEDSTVIGSDSGPYYLGACFPQGAAGPSGPAIRAHTAAVSRSNLEPGAEIEHWLDGTLCARSRRGRPVEISVPIQGMTR